MAYDVGTYTFTLTGKDGKPEKVAARYSFVYKFDNKDKQWKIAHHHSSAHAREARRNPLSSGANHDPG